MFLNHWSAQADEDLMCLVQQGEARALTELYRRYSKKLIRYFHRMLWKDESRAQDFLHDLFVKVIESPGSFDSNRKFSTWLYSVAFNMCKNEYRKQAYREGIHASMIKEVNFETFQPDSDQGEFKQRLEAILASSEEGDRNLFVLRYELDLPLTEIATVLDCPEGTIKSRLFNLKKKLAQQLHFFDPAINLSA